MFVNIKHEYEYVLSQFELVLNRSDCCTQRLCPYLLRSNDKGYHYTLVAFNTIW